MQNLRKKLNRFGLKKKVILIRIILIEISQKNLKIQRKI